MLKEMISEKRMDAFLEKRDADFSYEIPGLGRFRVNAHFQRDTPSPWPSASSPTRCRRWTQLNLPEVITTSRPTCRAGWCW